MTSRSYLVTGGAGFLGSALVRRLVADGHRVRVLDNEFRGSASRLGDLAGKLEFVRGDVRNPAAVSAAMRGVECVWHLAFINRTKFFYTRPDLVLEVAVKGIINVLDACITQNVPELLVGVQFGGVLHNGAHPY